MASCSPRQTPRTWAMGERGRQSTRELPRMRASGPPPRDRPAVPPTGGEREAAKKKGRAKAELTPAHTPHASNRPLLSESAIPLPRQHAERRKVRGELIGCFVSVSIGGGPDVSGRQGASFKPNGLASRLRGSAQRPRKNGVGPAGRRRDSRPRGRSAFARLVSMAASRTPEEMQGADWLSVCVPIG